MQRQIIFFLLTILILTSVSAQEQDFLAFGDTTINAVPCESTVKNVTIQNLRTEQTTFSLSVDGDASDFVTFSLLNFILDPGQIATINTYYTIPCTTTPGTYSTDLFFNDGQIEKTLTQEVMVTIPDNINATITQNSLVSAPCETAGFAINLHNPLAFTEIYSISATGHENVHVSEKATVLQANERKTIMVSVTPDDCTQSGTFGLTTRIQTEKSSQQKEIPLELIIKSTDIPILAEGTSNIRTDYTDSTADITIQNTGDRITQYGIVLEGPDWATITPSVSLNPGETKTLALRLAPTEDVPKGNYALTINAIVEQTGITYSKEVNIKLKPITFMESNPVAFIAIIIVIIAVLIGAIYLVKYTRSDKFKQKLARWKQRIKEHKAKRAEAIKIKAQKKAEARKLAEQKKAQLLKQKLEQQRKLLEKQQAEREKIKKQQEQKSIKEQKIAAKKVKLSKESKLKIFTLAFVAILLIIIGAGWSIIAPNTEYVIVGLALLGVIFLAKKLARQRVVRMNWKTFPQNKTTTVHAWKQGLSLLSITSKEQLNNFKLLIRKTKARISPAPTVYQTFQIKTNSETEQQTKATITISKNWLSRKEISTDDVKLARYNNQVWSTIPLKKTGETKTLVHFTAELNKQGTYSIYAKTKSQKTTPKLPINKTFWTILALGIIIAGAIALSPQTTITKGIPPQVWAQDTVHNVDLSKYFKDPDSDKLTYAITGNEHITIDVAGNTAYFTPETGWTGEERIKIQADDGKGGIMTSNTIPLRVQKNIIPAKIQPYIAIIISILAIILLIWTVRLQQKK